MFGVGDFYERYVTFAVERARASEAYRTYGWFCCIGKSFRRRNPENVRVEKKKEEMEEKYHLEDSRTKKSIQKRAALYLKSDICGNVFFSTNNNL
jgi:hypothetical protein